MIKNKVTFTNKGQNPAQLNATGHLVIEDQTNALKNENLPHNFMVLTNQDSTSTLFIYLDDFSDQDIPDYVLFPSSTMVLNLDDGVSFTTVYVKNVDAANNIAAKDIKYKICTIKEV